MAPPIRLRAICTYLSPIRTLEFSLKKESKSSSYLNLNSMSPLKLMFNCDKVSLHGDVTNWLTNSFIIGIYYILGIEFFYSSGNSFKCSDV